MSKIKSFVVNSSTIFIAIFVAVAVAVGVVVSILCETVSTIIEISMSHFEAWKGTVGDFKDHMEAIVGGKEEEKVDEQIH